MGSHFLLNALGVMNLVVGVYSLASSVRFLAYLRRTAEEDRTPPADAPPVALLVPCCGVEEGLEDNLRALLRQDYPSLRLVFIAESEDDASLPVIEHLISEESREAKVVIAGPTDRRSQKVHNLLAGLAEIGPAEVLAFADSDGRPDRGWLRRLVEPLGRKEVGVSTGYRFYIPERSNFASLARSAWNAGVLTLFGDHDHNFAWGGSMAIRREVFEAAGVVRAWQGVLSDDYALTHAVRRAGYRVEFVPRCLVLSGGKVTVGELLRWLTRQMSITRVYWRKLWLIAGGSQIVYSLFLLWALLASFGGDLGAAFWLGAVVLLGGLSGGLRAGALSLLGPEWRVRLRGYFWTYPFLVPLVSFLTAYGFLRSAVSRRVEWRGKIYEMRAPTETIVGRGPIGSDQRHAGPRRLR